MESNSFRLFSNMDKRFSFNDTFEKLQSFIREEYSVENYSSKFTSLEQNHEKVFMTYQLLAEANLLPENVAISPKSSEESTSFRERGNKEFLQKQDLLAIETYSISAAIAPICSIELALAFANRSAVTFHLKEYPTCIIDIDRAIAGNYPKHLFYKLYERKAKCQIYIGMNQSAKETLKLALESLALCHLDEFKIKSITSSLIECLNTCSGNDTLIKENKKCVPCLTGNRNDTLLSASSLVQIEYSHELGRHLVATADIEPGDTLVIEEPFASVLLPTSYSNYCFHCKKRCHSLLPCPYCVVALFCDEECRNASWDHSHRFECSLVPLLVANDFTKIELIAVRTLLMASKRYKSFDDLMKAVAQIESNEINNPKDKGLDGNGHYNSDDYTSVHHLVGNMELRSTADVFRRASTAACIVHLLCKFTDYFTSSYKENNSEININIHCENNRQPLDSIKFFIGGLLFHFLMIVPSNAHEVSEMVSRRGDKKMNCESVEIGGALYPTLSLINHSCDPNVVRHSHNGDTNVLTAIKVIAAGEEILDNYGYHHAIHDVTTRQSNLYRQYLFYCQCVACQENWPHYSKLPTSKPVFINPRLKDELEISSKIFQEVLTNIKAGSMKGQLGFLYAHLSLMHRTIKRPWKEYSACQEAIKQCLSQQANHYSVH